MLKSFLKNVIAVSAVLFPIASAQASDTKDPLARWVAQVNQQIDWRAQLPISDAAGRAVIVFRRGADGRAYDVSATSGQRAIAAAGVRTIRRLRNLPRLPNGLPTDQRIVMNFLVGKPNDRFDVEAERKELLASASKINAEIAAQMGSTQVAFSGR